jgi:hypothetical protein
VSLERTKSGDWRVRWRASGRNRSKVTGPRKADAIAFEAEVKRNKRIGSIVPDEMGKANRLDFGYRDSMTATSPARPPRPAPSTATSGTSTSSPPSAPESSQTSP